MIAILPPESKPYGLPYVGHIIKDWQRVLSIPKDQNPMEDNTGAKCISGCEPMDPVLYLSGNIGGDQSRNIPQNIVQGTGLYVSVNQVVVTGAEAPNSTVETLGQLAKEDQDSTTWTSLKINEQEFDFEELKNYRFSTGPFDVELPNNALWGAPAGNYKAVADGFYVITEPLPAGNYHVTTEAQVAKPFNQPPPWNSKVNYHFKVS